MRRVMVLYRPVGEVEFDLIGDGFRGQCLSGAGLAGEQRSQTLASRIFVGKAPVTIDPVTLAQLTHDVAQNGELAGRQLAEVLGKTIDAVDGVPV